MATFTRDWNESVPTDANYAYDIDDYIRQLRVDTSDRLKDMVYGFTAGENDGVQGFKEVIFKQQSGAPGTPNADEITLYSIDDGTDAGLYAIQEDGYTKQILKTSGTSLLLNIAEADITGKTLGAITVSGLTASANLDIGAYELRAQTLEADVATGTAPLTIASTTKVTNLNADKIDGYDITAAADQESNTLAGGLVIKCGEGDAMGAITFGAAFPTSCITVVVCYSEEVGGIDPKPAGATSISAAGFTAVGESGTTVNWIAIGI